MKAIVCDRCGQAAIQKHATGGTGYGKDEDGNRICYRCCGDLDRQYMRGNPKIVLYLSRRGSPSSSQWFVSNWPGSLEFGPVAVSHGRHNIAGSRRDCWFIADGQHWWGVSYGDWTEIVHCKKVKDWTIA